MAPQTAFAIASDPLHTAIDNVTKYVKNYQLLDCFLSFICYSIFVTFTNRHLTRNPMNDVVVIWQAII